MSRSTRQAPAVTDRLSTTIKPLGPERLGDMGSRQLRGQAGREGNQQVDEKLQKGSSMRDALVRFAGDRLQAMHQVQSVEHAEMARERTWFKGVAAGRDGQHLPDPTRWHEAAKLYRGGVIAMCNGNLSQGAALLDQALEAERAAFQSVPRMVQEKLDHTHSHAAGAPAELANVGPAAACPVTSLPKELRFAELILNIDDIKEQTPPLDERVRGNAWWNEEEEDQDDGEEA